MKRPQWSGPACPTDETHGRLLDWPGERTAYFCPHAAHLGGAYFATDLIEISPRGLEGHPGADPGHERRSPSTSPTPRLAGRKRAPDGDRLSL